MHPFAALLWLAAPQAVSVTKVWDAGEHNAFTDLIRYKDEWFVTFRESQAHVGGNGVIRVLVSGDGARWVSAAVLAEEGRDLRDPKLSRMPDGRLMLLAGGSLYEGKTLKGRQPRVAFSRDGRAWTAPQPILADGEWLWRVTWNRGTGYGVSYGKGGGVLYSTRDGLRYDRVTALDAPGVSEVTLRFVRDRMIALVRRETDDRSGWIGFSDPPYTHWTWKSAGHRLGGPNFIVLPDGSMWAGSREHTPEGARMALARMTATSYEPALLLPSGGDCSYPGLVWHGGLLWVSYYSSHEGKSAIYLGKVALAR